MNLDAAMTADACRPTRHRIAYVGLLLFTLTLYLRPNDFLPIGEFPVAKIIAVGALAAFLMEGRPSGQPLSILPKELKYLMWLLALMFLSVPLAINPVEAFDTITDLFLKVALVFILLINTVTSYRRLRRLMSLTVLVGGGIAISALRNFVAGQDLVGGFRADGIGKGIFGNPNDMAFMLSMLIPLAVELGLTAAARPTKLLYYICAGVMVSAVYVSYSRAGLLALFAAGGLVLVGMGRQHPRVRLLVILAVLALIMFAPEGYGLRVLSIFDSKLDATGSSAARMNLLIRGLQTVAFNPKVWLVGIGVGNFYAVSIHDQVTHNSYLQVLTEIGVPALVVYILFIVHAFKGLKPIISAGTRGLDLEDWSVTAMAIRATLLAYAVGSFFGSVAYQWHLYYAAGYAVCLRQIAETARSSEANHTAQ
jgi:O-antigen ligase